MKFSKRWMPAIIAPAVIAAGAIAVPLQANAVDLPDLTPQEVMLLMEGDVTGFSGTIVKTSDLGLPPLEMSSMMDEEMIKEMEEKMPEGFEEFIPQLIEQNVFTQAIELIAGTHTFRVYASDQGMRVQVLDPMSQRDLIINENEMWLYNAREATAQTAKFDFEVSDLEAEEAEAMVRQQLEAYAAELQLDLSNPEAVADYLMSMVSEDTEVSVGKDHLVAGRTAYQLIAQPKATNSVIESVVISVDSETGMALRVEVFSIEKDTAVFVVGFESISFQAPDRALFSFTPPAGTIVTELELPAELEAELESLRNEYEANKPSEAELEAKKAELEARYADQPMPQMIGEGWETVLFLPAIPNEVPMAMLENELFADLMETVSIGKVFSTPVMNVLVTDSGEVYAGAVTIEYLLEVAAR